MFVSCESFGHCFVDNIQERKRNAGRTIEMVLKDIK